MVLVCFSVVLKLHLKNLGICLLHYNDDDDDDGDDDNNNNNDDNAINKIANF